MLGKIKWVFIPIPTKKMTEGKAIESNALPPKVILPIRQHIGAPAEPLVKKGDMVKKGQLMRREMHLYQAISMPPFPAR
jgi:electron transport complex protein RnfC